MEQPKQETMTAAAALTGLSSSNPSPEETVPTKETVKRVPSIEVTKTFPQILMDIISDPNNEEIISWLPHGCSFRILNRQRFLTELVPVYYKQKKNIKYTSFSRKLSRWDFVRLSSGPDTGAFYHKHFQRDDPLLVRKMFCKGERPTIVKNFQQGVGGTQLGGLVQTFGGIGLSNPLLGFNAAGIANTATNTVRNADVHSSASTVNVVPDMNAFLNSMGKGEVSTSSLLAQQQLLQQQQLYLQQQLASMQGGMYNPPQPQDTSMMAQQQPLQPNDVMDYQQQLRPLELPDNYQQPQAQQAVQHTDQQQHQQLPLSHDPSPHVQEEPRPEEEVSHEPSPHVQDQPRSEEEHQFQAQPQLEPEQEQEQHQPQGEPTQEPSQSTPTLQEQIYLLQQQMHERQAQHLPMFAQQMAVMDPQDFLNAHKLEGGAESTVAAQHTFGMMHRRSSDIGSPDGSNNADEPRDAKRAWAA